MKIVLASSNKNKFREFQRILSGYEIYMFNEFIKPFEIIENGLSFEENALIKARSVYAKLKNLGDDFIVIGDDSGISVDALGGEPGIFSARFAGLSASDQENNEKLISKLNELNLISSSAYFSAAIAVVCKFEEFVVKEDLNGKVLNFNKGKFGFGYDSLFVPCGFDKTLAELGDEIKDKISHRKKAINKVKENLEKLGLVL